MLTAVDEERSKASTTQLIFTPPSEPRACRCPNLQVSARLPPTRYDRGNDIKRLNESGVVYFMERKWTKRATMMR